MNRTRILLALAIFGSPCGLVSQVALAVPVSLLHSFAGGTADGSAPVAPLTLSGNALYGTTLFGGGSLAGKGTVFSVNTDGTGYQVLHKFTGSTSDGSGAYSGVVTDGTTLYGTTHLGGSNNLGVVYAMNPDGTNFHLLHSFTGGTSDGVHSVGGVTLAGNKLYGTAASGGASNFGIIYSLNTDGTGFQVVHSFAGGSGGLDPETGVLVSGAVLYGVTLQGGSGHWGTVYSMNTDGTNFQVLHSFAGGTSDGRIPDDLTISDTKLYGVTFSASTYDSGTVFSMNTDGTGYHNIHIFGSPGDGADPHGGVTVIGGSLIGTTQLGGPGNDSGVIFLMHTDGTSYQILHANDGPPGDLSIMAASLTVDGNTVYGISEDGGLYDHGTVFTLVVPEPSTWILASAGLAALVAWSRRKPAPAQFTTGASAPCRS